jgi:hypothetical protein
MRLELGIALFFSLLELTKVVVVFDEILVQPQEFSTFNLVFSSQRTMVLTSNQYVVSLPFVGTNESSMFEVFHDHGSSVRRLGAAQLSIKK